MTCYSKLDYSGHPHALFLKSKVTPYTCNGCLEFGLLTRYECEDDEQSPPCRFHLHKECARPDPETTHAFHPDCTFKFLAEPETPGKRCSACARIITGCNYYCHGKDLCLHPRCAKLPFTREEGEVILQLRQEVSSKCYRCHLMGYQYQQKSWSYVSTGGVFHIHIACVMDMLIEDWEREHLGLQGGCNGKEKANDEETALAATKIPMLRFVVDDGKQKWRAKLDSFMTVIDIASKIRAIFTNPNAAIANFFASRSSG